MRWIWKVSEYCTCFHSFMMCYQCFLFLLAFSSSSAKPTSTSAKGHQSKEMSSTSSSLNGNTTLFYTNMTDLQLRTTPQRETPANVTTPQPNSTTQLASTMTVSSPKSERSASQGADTTTSSQQKAKITLPKSTTKQQSTAGRSQSQKGTHGICSSWLC